MRGAALHVFGADAARLEEAGTVLAERLGPAEAARLGVRGAALSDDEVVAHVCSVLAATDGG